MGSLAGKWFVNSSVVTDHGSDGMPRKRYEIVDLGEDGYPRFRLATIDWMSNGEEVANKMAAADEMLEALEALAAHVGDGQYVSRSAMSAALAAIAKARGQS